MFSKSVGAGSPFGIVRKLSRLRFTVIFIAGVLALLSLITFALFDSLNSGRANEQQVRESTLSAELSNFLLTTKEPDNTSLLENPAFFSAAERPLSVVTLKSSFYTYLLNRANAKSLTAEKINWDAPRPCVLEFSRNAQKLAGSTFTLQACFSAVPADSNGRYIYFSIRYPSPPIARHKSGANVNSGDRVVLFFGAEKPLAITLVFERPTLAASRYPSQMDRFSGIHEMSAFLPLSSDRATRAVNAQAYEKLSEDNARDSFVTIVGRIDAGLLDGPSLSSAEWPSKAISRLKIGIDVFGGSEKDSSRELIHVESAELGQSLVSLQKAYLSSVTKGARLEITRSAAGKVENVWSSEDLNLPQASRRSTPSQKLFDYWARLTKLGGLSSSTPVTVKKEHRIGGTSGLITASLTAEPAVLPEVATRSFGWLTTALLLLSLLSIGGIYAAARLIALGRRAWRLSRRNVAVGSAQSPYGHRQDEISRLGRILYLYFNQITRRHIDLARRISAENAAKSKDMRLMQAQLELRQASLDAIGHEIRSPLQSLLNQVAEDSDLREPLLRMQDGIEKIYLAASVEDGIGDREIICSPEDLAVFLSQYVSNKSASIKKIRYDGQTSGAWVALDPIMFETVIDHLIDNADRYRQDEGGIRISLSVHEDAVVVEVFNNGPGISDDLMPYLFKVGTTDRATNRNRGLGLYASRAYLFGMQATISAENRFHGVAMVIVFPQIKNPG